MAGSEVKVVISATDNASRVFKAVGSSASGMAKDLTTAGQAGSKAFDGLDREAQQAGKSLDSLGRDAQQAGQAIQRTGQQTQAAGRDWNQFQQNAVKAGAAIGTVTGLLSKAGQASVNQTNSIRALRAAYGDSADELIKFADGIQQTTIYSNDAARASALFAQSLAANYGLSTQQIEELIARSADLAAVTGMDLFDAVQRTSGAIRGEGEAAERLGLNMSDAAVAAAAAAAGLEGWNTTMTESEKAAFRFTVFLEQSNYALGQAASQADTTAGRTRQLVNEFQDLATSAGRLSGPVGEVLSVAGDMAIAFPAAGAAIGVVVTQLAKLRAASAVASLALGPVGIAAAAAVAIGALAYYVIQSRNTESASEAAAKGVESLTKSMRELAVAGADATTTLFGQALTTQFEQMGRLADTYEALKKQLVTTTTPQVGVPAEAVPGWGELDVAMRRYALTAKQAEEVQADLDTIMRYTGPNVDNVRRVTNLLNQEQNAGQIGGKAYAEGVDYISKNLDTLWVSVDKTTGAASKLSEEQQKLIDEADEMAAAVSRNQSPFMGLTDAMLAEAEAQRASTEAKQAGIDAANEQAAAVSANQSPFLGMVDIMQEDARLTAENTARHQELANSYAESVGIVTTLDGTYQGLSVALGIVANDFLDVAVAMQGINDAGGALNIADAVNDAAQALDGVLATFQAIDALGQRSESAGSIAKNLIGEPGELALIDELLANGAIQIGTYNAAVEAGTSIAASNAAAQESLNAVRAAQLPTLASANAAYADELARISELAPAQQALALAYMDSATQAKASELASLALSASMGELGENGQRVATNIIAAGAAADPVLKSLLTDMGLIEEGAEGDIKVNFPDADTATQAIRNLEDAIDDLNVTLGGLPSRKELEVATKVTGPLADGIGKGAKGAGIFDIPDQSANITVNTSVTGALAADITGMAGVGKGAKGGGLFSIEDQSATVTVDTRQTGASIPAIKTDVDAIDGTTATATVDVNDQASIPIDSIAMRAHAYGGSIHTAGLRADSTPAEETIAATTASGVGYASNIFVSTLDGNPEPFYGNVGAAIGVGDSFGGTTFTSTVDGNPDPFYGSVGAAEGVGNSFAGSVYTASIDGDAGGFYSTAGAINGSTVGTAYINIQAVYSGAASISPFAHGGTVWADRAPAEVEHAAHGRAGAGRTVMVGEYGRELVTLPTGSFVTPHPATESRVRESSRGGRGDGGIRIQTLNLYPATPDVRGAIEARTRTAYRTG